MLTRKSGRPVSTSDAIRTLRTVMRDCALSDAELTNLIAESAIEHGLDVSFDGYPRPEEIVASIRRESA
jgi:hypothetical protein